LSALVAAVTERWPTVGAQLPVQGTDPDDEYAEDFEVDDRQAGGLSARAAEPPAVQPTTALEADFPVVHPDAALPKAQGLDVDEGYSDDGFEDTALEPSELPPGDFGDCPDASPEILAAVPEVESNRSAREAHGIVEEPSAQPEKPQSPSTNDGDEAGYCDDFDDEEGELEDLGSFDYAEDAEDAGPPCINEDDEDDDDILD